MAECARSVLLGSGQVAHRALHPGSNRVLVGTALLDRVIVLPMNSTLSGQRDARRSALVWLADGTGLLTAAALGLLAAGLFAWFLAVTDRLLPHDLAWLSISEEQLPSGRRRAPRALHGS